MREEMRERYIALEPDVSLQELRAVCRANVEQNREVLEPLLLLMLKKGSKLPGFEEMSKINHEYRPQKKTEGREYTPMELALLMRLDVGLSLLSQLCCLKEIM